MATSPEVLRPNHRTPPHTSEVAPADEVRTIMLNQVSWGAVFAGAALALVMQIILNMIGLGVGLSTLDIAQGDTPSAGSISLGAGIWFVLLSLLTLGMIGLGYHTAIADSRRSRVVPILAVAFSLVIALIAALDHPGDSLMPISQQPLVEVQSELKVQPGTEHR